MKTIGQKEAGFSVVIIAVLVLFLGAIGFVAFRFFEAQKPKSEKTYSTQTQESDTDPYEKWKTYCDNIMHACFKYPEDWTIDTNSQDGMISTIIKSPSNSTAGIYNNSDTRGGTDVPHYIASVDKLNKDGDRVSVLGSITLSSNPASPRYKIIDSNLTANIKPGQNASLINTARFTFNDATSGRFELYPITSNDFTLEQAKAWFSSQDAKTALLIAKSFSLK